MGLRDDVQTAVSEAFDGDLADAVQDFTAERETVSDAFDAPTGTYPTTTVVYTGRGVFGSYLAQEIDEQHILQTDRKLIALQSEVVRNGAAFTPAVDDIIDGARVVDAGQDPASATWTLQLRRT